MEPENEGGCATIDDNDDMMLPIDDYGLLPVYPVQ